MECDIAATKVHMFNANEFHPNPNLQTNLLLDSNDKKQNNGDPNENVRKLNIVYWTDTYLLAGLSPDVNCQVKLVPGTVKTKSKNGAEAFVTSLVSGVCY